MNHNRIQVFEKIEQYVEATFIFLFPLFFLPLFTDVLGMAKLSLITTVIIGLLMLKAAKLIVTKQAEWRATPYDTALFAVLLAYLVSVIFNAPNKIESLLEPLRGAYYPVSLIILYFLLPKRSAALGVGAAYAGLIVAGIFSALSYFGAFNGISDQWSFLNQKTFSPVGNYLNLAVYGAFLTAFLIPHVITEEDHDPELVPPKADRRGMRSALDLGLFTASLAITIGASYIVLKDLQPALLPHTYVWQTFVESLKSARTAFLGVGPANFDTMFVVAKNSGYNSLAGFWNITPEVGSSALLHIFTETGLLGAAALLLLGYQLYRRSGVVKSLPAFVVLAVALIFLPLSMTTWWLVFILALSTTTSLSHKKADLSAIPVAYATFAGLSLIAAGLLVWGGWRVFQAEYYFRQSTVVTQGNEVYNNQVQAITLNPYREVYHLSFSQTNLALASNIAQKKNPSDQDKQTVSQLVQQAIQEAKTTVSLNPARAQYWAYLGTVYRNLLTVAQGADVWTISSYQRAISLDPRNPSYYFSLGSTYYGLKNYSEAVRFFEQAVMLKSDIPNYHYNLAWAYYQNKQYREAVTQLEGAVSLITDTSSNDYKQAKKDLDIFKKALTEEEKNNPQAQTESTPETLTQPTPFPSVSPEISLPPQNAPPL